MQEWIKVRSNNMLKNIRENLLNDFEVRFHYIKLKESHINSFFNLVIFPYLFFIFVYNIFLKNKKNKLNKNNFIVINNDKDFDEVLSIVTQKEIISFDIFGTLILRNCKDPTEIFNIVGEKLHINNFRKLRIEVELELRKNKIKKVGHSEVDLSEIWNSLEKKIGVCKHIGLQTEIETEIENSRNNNYLLRLINEITEKNKKFICLSDMYLSRKDLENMLIQLGYPKPALILVSNEHSCSKASGKLYSVLEEKCVDLHKIIHIGDDTYSDIYMANKMGVDAVYYCLEN